MIQAFVNNPVKVIVGVLLVALFGVIGLYQMPRQLTPEVEIPTVTVETRWPGASPQEVERQIVQEQEQQLKSVEGVVKMSSESMYGMGKITLEFSVGTNMQEALLKVNTRLQQVPRYPRNARSPIISTPGSRPIAWFILKPRAPTQAQIAEFQKQHPELKEALEPARKAYNAGLRARRLRDAAAKYPEIKPLLPPDLDLPAYRKFAEEFVEARFERVAGVANSDVLGGREEELQVIVDPAKLAARKLTIRDVSHALEAANLDTSAGDIWEEKRGYKVRTLGQFKSEEEVRKVVLARQDGQTVTVADVAEVKLGFKKPDGIVKQFGQTCIAVNCQRTVGANVIEVMTELKIACDEMNNGILAERGLYLEHVYDETEYINSAIGLVEDNIVVGGILTIAILIMFLRSARSTLVISLAIPTSIVGTFLVLNLMGRSLNVVSLAGLAFAVGMLVDNAVVVLENIFQHWEKGKKPFRAAIDGTSEVWGAVLSSTLTTLAVFIPIVFVKEEAGQLFRDIALAISAGVGLSLIVSLTLVPMLAARLLTSQNQPKSASKVDPSTNGHPISSDETHPPPVQSERTRLGRLLDPFDWIGRSFTRFVMGANDRLQRSVFARLAVVVGFTAAALYLSYLMMPKVEYLPNGNQNLVLGFLMPPPGYNLDQLTEMGTEIENRMRPYWDIDDDDPRINELKYPALKDFFFVCRGRMVFMGLKARDELRAGELVGLVRAVGSDLPGTFAFGKQMSLFEQGLTAGRTIDVEITGPELEKLTQLGGRVLGQVMQKIPGAQALPQPSLDLSSPELHVLIKRSEAADNKLDETQIGEAVMAMIDGSYVGDYYKDGYKIDLTVISQKNAVRSTQDLGQVPLATPNGDLVSLGTVADIKLRSGPEQINHRQRLRTITIQVSPPPDMPLEDAMRIINDDIVKPIRDEGQLGGGQYQINLAGTADKLRSTWKALEFNLLLVVLITYLLMAALFESWLYPFVVILSVPLGALGGFAGLYLLNQFVLAPLDVITMLGFVILIGTVVNNPILIVEQALILIRTEKMHFRPAVLQAVKQRIRPIFMTTLTTLFGLLPLVLIPGAGSELYRGLGAVLLGGLLVSTVVSLFIIPAVFTLTLELKEYLIRKLFTDRGGDMAREASIDVAIGERKADVATPS